MRYVDVLKFGREIIKRERRQMLHRLGTKTVVLYGTTHAPVVRSPDRYAFEKAQSLDIIFVVKCESVVDALRKNNQIVLFDLDANPSVLAVSHVKVSRPVQTVTNFL
jgi:hypothetical protein